MAENKSHKATNGSTPPSARELFDETRRVRGDLHALAEHTTHAVSGWRRFLRARLEDNPYATFAVAAGVGAVLGGGLPTPVLRIALLLGTRLAAERFIGEVARTFVEPKD